jgi:hypothetical protein
LLSFSGTIVFVLIDFLLVAFCGRHIYHSGSQKQQGSLAKIEGGEAIAAWAN